MRPAGAKAALDATDDYNSNDGNDIKIMKESNYNDNGNGND